MNHSSVLQYEFSRKSEIDVFDFTELTLLPLPRRRAKSQRKQISVLHVKSHQLLYIPSIAGVQNLEYFLMCSCPDLVNNYNITIYISNRIKKYNY